MRIEGAYFHRSIGAPAYAGVFAAWCDLREVIPYAFGYMMAAKIGTGIVAEFGAMRISDEIDALEVMGVRPSLPRGYPAPRRVDGAALHVPRRRRDRLLRQLARGRRADRRRLLGRLLLIFWMFQNPPDLLFSLIKGMVMATAIVLVGCYYGYTASGGPCVGTATAKSMVLNIVLVHLIGMMGTLVFWARTPGPRSAGEPATGATGDRPCLE